MSRPTKATINLRAIKHNFQLAQSLVTESVGECGQCIAVLKANAYGHGAVEVAKALESVAPVFAVACLEEAEELREAGIKTPVLLLQGFYAIEEVIVAAEKDYWLMIATSQQVRDLTTAQIPKRVRVWLKVDSGMARLGVPLADLEDSYQRLQDSDNVKQDIVIATHLSTADDLDSTGVDEQLQRFKSALGTISAPTSMANSAGILAWPQTRSQWNRPGYMLYGNTPLSGDHPLADQLQVAMTLSSQVVSVRGISRGESVGYSGNWTAERDSLIATVPIGYGDGYPRGAKNGTPVLIAGCRAELVGRVSMDLISVDVTDVAAVAVGDKVILWGEQLSVNEVALWADTIGYELIARMPLRVPRIYS